MFSSVKWIAINLCAFAMLCPAGDLDKPVCSAETRGNLWPEEANHDPNLLALLARCGKLEMCTRGARRHYHWESLAVRVDQLRRGSAEAPASCAGTVGGSINPVKTATAR